MPREGFPCDSVLNPRPTSATPTEASVSESRLGSPWQKVSPCPRGRRGGAPEGRGRAALPAGGARAVRSPAPPPLERPHFRFWPEPAPRSRKHLAAGEGWLGPAGGFLGWTVSSLPSAWAVARTPRCTRPTPRWVWAGRARGVLAPGTRLLCQPTPSKPGWVTGRPEQERGGRLASGGWKRLEPTAPLRFKNKHTPVCSGRVGEDLREPRCQWLKNRLPLEVAFGAGRSLRPDSQEAGPVS